MGTKNDPGKFDCYAAAEPDEPMFVLLGRDPMAGALVKLWARAREMAGEDLEKVAEALKCADAMSAWAAKKVGERALLAAWRALATVEQCAADEWFARRGETVEVRQAALDRIAARDGEARERIREIVAAEGTYREEVLKVVAEKRPDLLFKFKREFEQQERDGFPTDSLVRALMDVGEMTGVLADGAELAIVATRARDSVPCARCRAPRTEWCGTRDGKPFVCAGRLDAADVFHRFAEHQESRDREGERREYNEGCAVRLEDARGETVRWWRRGELESFPDESPYAVSWCGDHYRVVSEGAMLGEASVHDLPFEVVYREVAEKDPLRDYEREGVYEMPPEKS